MEVKLLELYLKNFKGIPEFTLKPEGQSVVVRGQNGTGKTTLLDAWLWLTTDKNSYGQSDFSLKTLDNNNEPFSQLEHLVSARLDVDGTERTFSKMLYEEWRKPKNSSRPTFRGNKIVYFVDGEKLAKKKEWEAALQEIAHEETLKLLTHDYFTRLHWKERRRILLSMAGDVSMEEVIGTDPSLQKVPEFLGKKGDPDRKRKELNDQLKQVEKDRDAIPPKIHELEASISEVQGLSRHITKENIEEYKQRINQVKQGGADPEVVQERDSLQEEKRQLQEQERDRRSQEVERLQEEISRLNSERREAAGGLAQLERSLEEKDREIKKEQRTYEQLRAEYKEVQAQEVEQDTCPWCFKPIEEDEKEELFKEARQRKADTLKDLTEKGKASKKKLEDLRAERNNLIDEDQQAAWQEKVNKNEKEVSELEGELQEIRRGESREFLPEGHDRRLEEIQERLQEIQEILSSSSPDTAELDRSLEEEQAKLAKIDAAEDTQKRLKELKEEEAAKNKEYEELSQAAYALDRYDERRASLLEDKINSLFYMTRFRLFERQQSGGVKPDCEILLDGVPFSTGLNKGSRILISLDINKTLAEFYGVWMPLFLDDKEGLTHEIDFSHQLISLVATLGVAKLGVQGAESGKTA